MYGPFIFLAACLAFYLLYRIQALRKLSRTDKRFLPFEGEDAIHEARIVGAGDNMFNASRYLRSVRNNSDCRWMTVAISQIIRTDMGTSRDTRLITNLAPGEERKLGHADDVQEGKYKIYIGYEILWARYTTQPSWYHPKNRKYPSPAEMYDEAWRRLNTDFMGDMHKQDRLGGELWP
ncbi:hypothetical protein [Chitinophaga sp. Cy-1792]|uniref:hypothetical protein n=1 Tax=Chitinophaga sp. Cy-1792 TaxID=2608339 RepID=UPI00141E6980|nr:hypothetical protein [Chitinophaga sp. Cy-1792]NIG56169.1 hypothetical protein [Chitinophaga sp. Cy-1792]